MAGMGTVSIPQELPLGAAGVGWTAADLETLPDDGRRYEIIDGVLLVSPAPTPYHQLASMRLIVLLVGAVVRGQQVLHAPVDWQPDETRSFQPDLLVMRRSDVTPKRLTGTPLVAVEILSPSTAQADRVRKFEAYAAAGVGQYWIVDPGAGGSAPSIEVYDLAESGGYALQVRGVGQDQVSVAGPVPVDVIPADLIA